MQKINFSLTNTLLSIGLVTLILLFGLGLINIQPASATQQSKTVEEIKNYQEKEGIKGAGANLQTFVGGGKDTVSEAKLGMEEANLFVVVGKAVSTILGLLGIIVLGLFLYAGFLWLTSMDKTEQQDKAKGLMKNAVIGLLIIILSFALTNFVIELINSFAS